MTECERIKETCKWSENFSLVEEVRCDYVVTEKLKKIWLVELDLLKQLENVCKKYNLTYWLGYGSLLGAVRHKGFIPWDDDLDVIMPRKDYNILKGLGNQFVWPFFLQTDETDRDGGYFYSYIKLRNSNTSSITLKHRYQTFNMGISLDVFCLDDWDICEGEERYKKVTNLIIDNSNLMRSSMPNPSEEDLIRIGNYSGNDPLDNLREIHRLCTQFADGIHCCVANMTLYGHQKSVFEKKWFFDTEWVKFETIEAPIPIGYDEILTTIYGDYMELPAVEKRGIWHSAEMNADIPYGTLRKKVM